MPPLRRHDGWATLPRGSAIARPGAVTRDSLLQVDISEATLRHSGSSAMSNNSTIAAPDERATDKLLYAAFAVPFLYYGTLLVASALYPGYDHVTQYASELGSALARFPAVFNTGTVLGGVCAILGGGGVFRALRSLDAGRLLASLLALAIILHGVGFVFGGLFPMPDDRHGGYGLGMGVLPGPLLAAIALRRAPRGLRWLTWFMAANAAAIVVMFAIMMGVGELVTRANVGLFQRGFTLTTMPWIALLAWALLRWRHRRFAH